MPKIRSCKCLINLHAHYYVAGLIKKLLLTGRCQNYKNVITKNIEMSNIQFFNFEIKINLHATFLKLFTKTFKYFAPLSKF